VCGLIATYSRSMTLPLAALAIDKVGPRPYHFLEPYNSVPGGTRHCAIAKMTARCALYASASYDIVLSLSRTSQAQQVFLCKIFSLPKFSHVPLGVGGLRLGYE